MYYTACYSPRGGGGSGACGSKRVWDEWNERHVAEHGVEPQEVEEVVSDQSSQFLRTRSPAEVQRYVVLGLTEAGRYLFVVLDPFGRGLAYVVTARDMSDEKRRFKRR